MATATETSTETRQDEKRAELASAFLAGQQTDTFKLKVSSSGSKGVVLPSVAVPLLKQVLELIAQGKAVTILARDTELSTQEGADLLNVSRPYFVGLLDSGELPHRKVGTHRRVLLEDVLTYKRQLAEKRREALKELTEQAQELALGYE